MTRRDLRAAARNPEGEGGAWMDCILWSGRGLNVRPGWRRRALYMHGMPTESKLLPRAALTGIVRQPHEGVPAKAEGLEASEPERRPDAETNRSKARGTARVKHVNTPRIRSSVELWSQPANLEHKPAPAVARSNDKSK